MPPFGRAHKLLSPTHPDTEPPAAGADPDDGQVATWSAALRAWVAAEPAAGGVSDHGLLDGLGDDDHGQYALADKSRPTTWVAAADLAGRSLADLGTKDHDLLDGLGDDDHSIYALLAGRSGGQTFVGGSGSGEHLTLQSTAHATRGYVRAQDDLQLLTDQLRSAAGTLRLELESGVADVRVHDDLRIDGHMGLGRDPSASEAFYLYPTIINTVGGTCGLFRPAIFRQTGGANRSWRALYGEATLIMDAGASGNVRVMDFLMGVLGAGTVNEMEGVRFQPQAMMYSGAAFPLRGLHLVAPSWLSATAPTPVQGLYMEDWGAGLGAVGSNIDAIRVLDQTTVTGTKRLLELGPATPHLRLLAGGDPFANESHLSLKLGATLKLVTEYDADSAGAGYRALRVLN